MPLNIDYRPVKLPPAPPASGPVVGGPVVREDAMASPDPVDPALVRAALDRHSAMRAGRQQRLRWRIALIAVIALVPMVLAAIGWGDPQGIRAARAAPESPVVAAVDRTNDHSGSPASAWDRTLAPVHGDGDSATAARPLASAGSAQDRGRALQCLTAAIYYEAAREPDDGQRAVAQVVLNRVAHPAFPKTVCGVVYQGSERPGCQFSFACDGSMLHPPMAQWWARARRVAEAALAGSVFAPIGLATHYHTSAVHPAWADTMTLVDTIGAHRFYRWSGTAGRPQAFAARYLGGEPLPAPHPRTWVSTGADFADPLALEKAFEAGRLAALRAAAAPVPDPAVTRVGAAFGQQPLPHAASTPRGAAPESGTVRPEAEQQYDAAAHWIRQPGT
jgi:spore germination cell wall hydrolase CwlJ-like protein